MRDESSVGAAFGDLSSLMEQAQLMVNHAKRISASLQAQAQAQAQVHAPASETSDERDLELMLAELGLERDALAWRNTSSSLSPPPSSSSSSSSSFASSSQFHTTLAQQIERVVARPLAARGGLLALTDVYCLVNRIRGTALVSPDDLLKACRLAHTFHIVTLPSKALALRLNELADAAVTEARIVAAIDAHPARSLTALEAAGVLHLAVPMAEQLLLQVEAAGAVCRDEGSQEGVRFWRNIFA